MRKSFTNKTTKDAFGKPGLHRKQSIAQQQRTIQTLISQLQSVNDKNKSLEEKVAYLENKSVSIPEQKSKPARKRKIIPINK